MTASTPGRRMPLGDQLEDEFLFADENRVAGIVAALIARDDVEALGQQVDYFALAFIAPLRAENNYVAHSSELL